MVHTDALEKEVTKNATWLDCFGGFNLRRTLIVCAIYAIQRLCGTGLSSYSTYFFEQAGLSTADAFDMSIGQACISILGALVAFGLMNYFGRRSLYVTGLTLQSIILLVVGFVGLAPSSSSASWAIGSLILIFQFVYGAAVGPICYAIVSELTSVRLRSKSVVLARASYEVVTLVNGVITPRMINSTAWNWGAKTGFFWGGICVLCTIFVFFSLPESKGRSYAELDALFARRVPARKFATTKIALFSQAPGSL
jgi:MFS transporter, SP family, general alpha glucoside:H+ symporter